jgi:hypothetical protein
MFFSEWIKNSIIVKVFNSCYYLLIGIIIYQYFHSEMLVAEQCRYPEKSKAGAT